MSQDVARGIKVAYAETSDFMIVALTGRTGSGCSTTADLMCRPFSDLDASIVRDDPNSIETRKHQIVRDFARINWQPFKKITVSTVILSYLLDAAWGEMESFLTTLNATENQKSELCAKFAELKALPEYPGFHETVAVGTRDRDQRIVAWRFYNDHLAPAADLIRSTLSGLYVPAFQKLGDNIRYSGQAFSSEVDQTKLFSLIQRVKRLAKAAFDSDRHEGISNTRIVIDAIRNPLELVYLRDQIAAFYAVAITTNDKERKDRLAAKGISDPDITAIDDKEYSKKPLRSYAEFVSQNIKDCIQKSDIFIANPGTGPTQNESLRRLKGQLIRYVSLMLRPGLVTPTREERCMQLAFVAKLNSGCISRQVGAAIADKDYSIKAVGWNDVPKGQISCLLRDARSLLGPGDSHTEHAFSTYEKNDPKLGAHLRQLLTHRDDLHATEGLGCAFCFKDAYNHVTSEPNEKKDNQVHTRSLHAEENAFLQLARQGNSGISGGYLYTTASPCELCSKKAYQLGITTIYYVDPYPGISSSHVLASGPNPPTLQLFSGAIGHAYHRLYEPILAVKDELLARLAGFA